MIKAIVPLASLVVTVMIYWSCKELYKRHRRIYLSPVIVSIVALIVLLWATRVPYPVYLSGTHYLTGFLGPATVAFAVPLYEHRKFIAQHAVTLIVTILSGVATAVFTSVVLAKVLHFNRQISMSLAPRSVTTPIALDISQFLHGNVVLTAMFVIITGIFGAVVGPLVIRFIRIRSAVARGLMMGLSAHAIGTARAFEIGESEGTFSSLGLVLAAIVTLVAAPVIAPLIYAFL